MTMTAKLRPGKSRDQEALESLLRDVQALAEAAADTVSACRRLGIAEIAKPLDRALQRLCR